MSLISAVKNSGQITLSISGEFTFPSYRQFIDAYQAEEKVTHFQVDMRKANYIDSAGLGMLLRLRDHALKQQATVGITPTPEIREILRIAKFDRLFKIED